MAIDEVKLWRWKNRLRKLVGDIPAGVTVLVNHGSMDICESEVVNSYADSHGHRDNVPSLFTIHNTGAFDPNSESM